MNSLSANKLWVPASVRRPRTIWSIWIALLFAFYGPAFGFAGQIRYVEAALLLIALLNLTAVFQSVGKWEKLFISLFFLTAIMHIIVDIYTGSDISSTIKRFGTYMLLVFLLPIMKWLGQDNWLRIKWILLGYCASYVTILYFGNISNPNYHIAPWRLGLGYSVTLAFCVAIAWRPKLLLPGAIALVGLSSFHLISGARSLALIVFIIAALTFLSTFRRNPIPNTINPIRLGILVGCGLIVLFGLYKLAEHGTDQNWYPIELQAKMEDQFSNPYGLISAARPDTAAAIFAVTKNPIIGYGSSNVDPDVWNYYIEISQANKSSRQDYESIFTRAYNQDWQLGTPSHSHLFGAWVDAGVLAILCWLTLLGLSIYVGSRAVLWQSRFAPLFTFVAVSNIWDILFSPGPHRMDIMIRLMIMLFALAHFRHLTNQQMQLASYHRKTKHFRNKPVLNYEAPFQG